MIADAVSKGIAEGPELDWKRCLPMDGQSPDWKGEFAKDVAAMANSGGGTIVFGVKESGAAASGVVDTGGLTDSQERTLRAVAFSNIHPPVLGTSFTSLSDGEKTVVVLQIPGSEESPHLIYKGDYFAAPLRDGSKTSWMKEKLLEDAYRARIDRRTQRTASLEQRLTQATVQSGERVWIAAAAIPSTLLSAPSKVDIELAREIFSDAIRLRYVLAERGRWAPFESIDGMNPRPGLRRWVDRSTATAVGTSKSSREVTAEVHHDGSVALACSAGDFLDFEEGAPNQVHADDVEGFVADFIALVASVARLAGVEGTYELALSIRWAGDGPILIRLPDGHNYLLNPSASRPIWSFETVYAAFDTGSGDEALRQITAQVSLDALNQGGGQHLRRIRPELSRLPR